MNEDNWSRRDACRLGALLGLLPAWLTASGDESMSTRKIPASGESLPIIGLGTYEVFDVSGTDQELAARREIVDLLLDRGGSLIDTSPMYNRSEAIIGKVLAANGRRDDCFLATKVWTDGKLSGERQMRESAQRMQADVIDLMQVHNLRDIDVHFATIRDAQQDGRVRYNGITHYTAGALDAMEAAMKKHRPQFIQINYSLGEREADSRLLPLAAETGTAVLINRPYMAGNLFAAVRGKAVPEWAHEYAASWGQFFLKFILGHPAVTSVIPATSKVHHVLDNLAAGFGPLPDTGARERMVRFVESL